MDELRSVLRLGMERAQLTSTKRFLISEPCSEITVHAFFRRGRSGDIRDVTNL